MYSIGLPEILICQGILAMEGRADWERARLEVKRPARQLTEMKLGAEASAVAGRGIRGLAG